MTEVEEVEDAIYVFNASSNPQAVDGAGVLPAYECAEAVDSAHNRMLIEEGILQITERPQAASEDEGTSGSEKPAAKTTKKGKE